MTTTLVRAVAAGAATLLLAGCAALNSVTSDVSSYGEWPADRKPGTYAFERLPSQDADPAARARTQALEAAAAPALQKAGFTAAPAGSAPDVLVQVGHRVQRERAIWADPLWWRGGIGAYRYGPWLGPGWGLHYRVDTLRVESEVALLLRDRASGKPLYEARASTDSGSRADSPLLAAMYQAALADFPKTGLNPRRVTVPLPGG